MERIYAILTDALGKPVYIDIYPEEIATTVSVWIMANPIHLFGAC
jgi:hypothetical protein